MGHPHHGDYDPDILDRDITATVFTDRDGDIVSVTRRDPRPGRSIPDPVLSVIRSPGSDAARRSCSVVMTDSEAHDMLQRTAAHLLGPDWLALLAVPNATFINARDSGVSGAEMVALAQTDHGQDALKILAALHHSTSTEGHRQ